MSGLRLIFAALYLPLASPLAAQSEGILVGMHIASQTQTLQFDTDKRKTEIDSIDIYWYERLTPRIEGGLILGYQEVTQVGNPIAAGQALSGEYLGITLRINLLQAEHLTVFTDLKYRYANAARTLDAQRIEWDWHQGQAELGLELGLGESLALTAGVGALRIDGRERATGTLNTVTNFDSADSAYARGGLKLLLDPYSHIGIEGETGAQSGGRIYFQRYF